MKADKETLKGKMEIIDQNMDFLESNEFDPQDSSFRDLQAFKHSMLEIVEACIDISGHIIAAEGFSRPSDYSDIFDPLADGGIIDDDLVENLGKMAKFRNFLVHRYDKVDPERLKGFQENDLEDVKKFLEKIYIYMEEEKK